MPCDAEAVFYTTNGEGNIKLVTEEGVVISCDPTTDIQYADGIGYTPHWSTCNAPDKFRKREAKK